MLAILTLLLACDPVEVTPTAAPAAGPSATDPVTEATAVTEAPGGPPAAKESLEDGWGALLVHDGQWFRTNDGAVAVGRKGIVPLTGTGEQGPCGELVAEPAGAMIVLKGDGAGVEVPEAPAIQAALVERAAWRMDELLPDLDPFAPAPEAGVPSRSRGVEVGSVVKARRKNAPPVLIATGHRECRGVLAILDLEASEVLVQDSLPDTCDKVRVLPPADLDGDGNRELAAWSEHHVVLYRLDEKPGSVGLTRLARWRCAP
ncbi:MAG: hypothetical protein H6742_16080 [Alphaproteobacteria bacterium]|nr:hypothetical protein [Alphaproteobacteria bacterium]